MAMAVSCYLYLLCEVGYSGAMHATDAVHEMGCTYERPELKPSE